MKCICGNEFEGFFCPYCGRKAPERREDVPLNLEKHCHRCGAKIQNGTRFCTKCGTLIEDSSKDKENVTVRNHNQRNTNGSELTQKHKLLIVGAVVCFALFMLMFAFKNVSNRYVDMIKESSFEAYPYECIGDAFEYFFEDPSWRYFETEDGEDVVEFTGECLYDGVEVSALVQFTIYDDDSFEITYLSYNNVSQNLLEIYWLLEEVFISYC